ncbi:retrotransposon protein, putative, ty1-copia subclass [Tanacetum coccineum]
MNNFNGWFHQLKMVLRVERKLFVIEQPISLASLTDFEYLRSGMRHAEFFKKRLINQEISGRAIDLEEIQEEEDTSPFEITSNIPQEVEGFEPPQPPQEQEILIRRSERTHRAPNRLCLNIAVEEHSLGDINEPTSYKAAMLDSKSNKWIDAMNTEIQSMMDNKVWVLVDLPPGSKTVGTKGYTQLYGVDYEETFSPVADIRAIRILISIAAYYDYEIWQMDVKTAFLNGYLDEDIYMVQPEGFIDPNHPRKVCKLKRSIYGLKQASRSWNKRFDEEIKRFGFAQNLDEPCVYQKASGSNVTFLILYVDDIIIMGNHIPSLQSVKDYLGRCFSMKDLGEAAFILGIKIYRDRSKRLIGLSQNAYMDKILKRYKMDNSKRGYIPMQERLDLNKSQGAQTPKEVNRMKNVPYASAVGSIMYAVRCTRPDVAFAQNITSRFQQNPGELHWTAVKNILKYLRNTKDMFLVYGGNPSTELRVECYCDAGFETDRDDTKSQTGYVFVLNGGAVDWKSSKQSTIAMSATESFKPFDLRKTCMASSTKHGVVERRNRENLGKLQPKADIGIFIGYAPTKKAFRIYNRRTRRIIETIHVDFDELTAMASEHSSSEPALHEMTPVSISSGLVPNPPSSTPFVPPTRTDWDLLFQPMFDESPNVDVHAPEVIAPIPEAVAPEHAVSNGSPSSTTVDQDAPTPSNSSTQQETQTPILSHDVEEDNHDIEVAHMGNDPYFGIPIPEVTSDQSASSVIIHTIVPPDHHVSEHNSKWTKDHPLENIIGALDRPVSTRLQLHEQALFCYYDAFLTSVEPKNYKEALTQACWIEAMQEELHEFERLEVWELVPPPDKAFVISLKWIYKVKLDELGGILKNKARLVARGYRQEEGIDFEESFAPVARLEAIRIFLAFAAHMNMVIYQMDVEDCVSECSTVAWYDHVVFIPGSIDFSKRLSGDPTMFIRRETGPNDLILITNLPIWLWIHENSNVTVITKALIAYATTMFYIPDLRHIDIRFHFIKEHVENDCDRTLLCQYGIAIADSSLKLLARKELNFLINKLGICGVLRGYSETIGR